MDIINESKFVTGFLPEKVPDKNSWILILAGKQLIMRKQEDKLAIPELSDFEHVPVDLKQVEYIGNYGQKDCFCIRLTDMIDLPEQLTWVEFMEVTKRSGDPGLFGLAGTANHILFWKQANQFCGRCGNKTADKPDERAKVCPACGNIIYPRISPAVITAVFRGNEILLAHNRNFREGLYSLIAGFVEPGEVLEECVKREILEEVGISVKNIRYFSSQPWPFPDSLMVAFTAEYESGEITVDESEIADAAWYQADHLPEIPSEDSVAGKLIRWYRDHFNEKSDHLGTRCQDKNCNNRL